MDAIAIKFYDAVKFVEIVKYFRELPRIAKLKPEVWALVEDCGWFKRMLACLVVLVGRRLAGW